MIPPWLFVDFDLVGFSVVVENVLFGCSSSRAQLSLLLFSLWGFSLITSVGKVYIVNIRRLVG